MSAGIKVDIAWSPTEPNRFITVGTDIQLYEIEDIKTDISKQAVTISERSCANIVTTSSDHQYLKCFSWYPKPEHPLLLAIGMVSGKVVFESLESSLSRDAEIAGREFSPKQNRSCNCISWNPVDANFLLQGLDKYRGENSILLWDIQRSMSNALDAVSTFERRSVFQLEPAAATKPVVEFGTSESTHSIHWFRNTPKLFVCGLSSKSLKIFDSRDPTKVQVSTQTKAIFNLCVDAQVEHRIASSVDNNIALWDVRNFEKPVTTIVQTKSILKMCWAPTRSGLLAILCKDSSNINLYDIQSPAMNDEVEPAIVERNLQPFASHPIMSFSWHPTQENRMLTISQNNQLLDYTVFDRITLNWSPTSEIVWTCGRKVLQCVDSRDDFYSCLDDISVKMRRRACYGYGLKTVKLWMNAELAEDPHLEGVWMWLDFVKAAESEWKRRSNPRHQPKFEGVHTVICGENGHTVLNSSEPIPGIWNGVTLAHGRISKYINEERKRALLVCGWSKDSDSVSFLKFLERLESDGHFARAAAIALFNLELRKAIEVLSRGASSKNYKGTADLNAIAMALAGYTDDKSALWREISGSLKRQLNDPYLRAMFTFLTAEDLNYDEILNESQIAVQDRMAFACLYLDDKKLADYLDTLKKRMCETGDLDGIILTGLTNDGLSLIQRYVDTVGDVQTASLIVLHSLPNKACGDSRAQAWVHCYRNLLDTWKLWKPRAMFDVKWFNNNPHAHKPKQQVYVSCNFCRRSVSYHLQQFRPPLTHMNNTRFAQTPVAPVNKKITCCPGCRKPMPRCSLCLSHMGTASGLNFLRETTSRIERKKVTDFSNWLTWCQTCRHGGHSAHILGWFHEICSLVNGYISPLRHHKECPVTGCSCKCMSLDAVANLKSLTVS